MGPRTSCQRLSNKDCYYQKLVKTSYKHKNRCHIGWEQDYCEKIILRNFVLANQNHWKIKLFTIEIETLNLKYNIYS